MTITTNTPDSPAEAQATHAPDAGVAAPLSWHEAKPVAQQIAGALGETEQTPYTAIIRAVRTLGAERALAFLAQAQAVEAAGGMMTVDGTRRRTPGGVYLFLLKQGVSREERWHIFPSPSAPAKRKPESGGDSAPNDGHKAKAAAKVGTTPTVWTDETMKAAIAQLEFGEARVKITLIGRAARVVEQGDAVLVGLRCQKKPQLPRGVPSPSPEAATTDYAVFVSARQWAPVARALADDPEDRLIVEGWPCLDPRFTRGITVYAVAATTKNLQAARRETQRGARASGE